MKVSELSGVALRWAVAEAEGLKSMVPTPSAVFVLYPNAVRFVPFRPDVDWGHGGPIIERERISVVAYAGHWRATNGPHVVEESYGFCDYDNNKVRTGQGDEDGNTPLVAAMRCLVASKLGDEINLPYELEKHNETA